MRQRRQAVSWGRRSRRISGRASGYGATARSRRRTDKAGGRGDGARTAITSSTTHAR